jgi:hypothetical protein
MTHLPDSHSDRDGNHTLIMTSSGLASPDALQQAALRAERNRRLAECDWTQIADAPLDKAQKTAWAAYRQALRDVPETTAGLHDVMWPEQP